MTGTKVWSGRLLSVFAFSLLFSYILTFQFEGQLLYSLLDFHEAKGSGLILGTILAHFAGLFSAGFFVNSIKAARYILLAGMGVCVVLTMPFFFAPSSVWLGSLIVGAYASGCAVAAWGYYLQAFTPRHERIKTCADALIFSNIMMIIINVVALKVSPFLGLALAIFGLLVGLGLIWVLGVDLEDSKHEKVEKRPRDELRRSLLLLCIFVAIITIDSGLMYEVINPAFEHLTGLVSWYWAVPYIVALVVLRYLPKKIKHANVLYAGMAMIMGAFIAFMALGRQAPDYLVVDTLMLAACGIFDLFWWSILGELLDYTEYPARVFGIGLSANVAGVLFGGIVGMIITSIGLSSAKVAVLALTVVCVTLVILPLLNRQLVLFLKNHAYLAVYESMSTPEQTAVLGKIDPLDPLTMREQEVLQLLLAGKSNREIAATLFITEHTVKTHARNIFSKYAVHSRAELISSLLKGDGNS